MEAGSGWGGAAAGSSFAGSGAAGAAGAASSFTSGGLALASGAGDSASGPTLRLSFGLFGCPLLGLKDALSSAPNMLLVGPPGGMGL